MADAPDADLASPAVPVVAGETTDRAALANALAAYNRKYLNNIRGVDAAGWPSAFGQQGLRPIFASTASYTLLDNHELGNRSLQSGGAPPAAPQGTPDPAFDVNTTGNFNNKTLAFQTIEKSYLDYHPTRVAMLGTPATGYAVVGPQVTAPADPRSNGTPQLYLLAEQVAGRQQHLHSDRRPQLSRHPTRQTSRQPHGRRCRNPGRQPCAHDARFDPAAVARSDTAAGPARPHSVEVRRDLVAHRSGRRRARAGRQILVGRVPGGARSPVKIHCRQPHRSCRLSDNRRPPNARFSIAVLGGSRRSEQTVLTDAIE